MTPDSYIEEDKVDQSTDRRLTLRLLEFVKPYWGWIVVSSVISLLMALLQLAGPWLIKEAIDKYISVADYNGLARMSALFIGSILLLFVLEYYLGYIIAHVGQKAMYDLRCALFNHVQRLELAFFDRNPVGRLMTRITSDVGALNEMFTQGVMTVAGDIFLLIAILVLMLKVNVTLTALLILTSPLLIIAAFLFRRKVRASHREVRMWLSRLNAYLQENLSGMRTVQAYNRQRKNFAMFSELNAHHRDANMKSVFYHAVFLPIIEIIAAIALALIVWYGGVASINGAITIGTVYLFIQYAQRFFQPIKDLSEKFSVFQTALASGERIVRLLDTPVTISSPAKPAPFEGLRERITFEDVWFAYKEEEWVLREINLEIRRGETVALVGSTGSGKTTITSLLARFYDVNRGAIKIDGADIRDIDLKALRNQVAVVLQDPFLFTGDISSNIRLGNEEITDDELRRCAAHVNAAQFIEQLPGKYANEVRERGATLSLGQKQLIAFARALAFDPDILILDEATASIDTETERLIQDALKKLLKGRTALVIAHRLSTIQNADKIVVLHHGKIREVGKHRELLRHGGIYRKLYELQYRAKPQRHKTQVHALPQHTAAG